MSNRIQTDVILPPRGMKVSVFSAIDGQARQGGTLCAGVGDVFVKRTNGPSLRLKPKGEDLWENEGGFTFAIFS